MLPADSLMIAQETSMIPLTITKPGSVSPLTSSDDILLSTATTSKDSPTLVQSNTSCSTEPSIEVRGTPITPYLGTHSPLSSSVTAHGYQEPNAPYARDDVASQTTSQLESNFDPASLSSTVVSSFFVAIEQNTCNISFEILRSLAHPFHPPHPFHFCLPHTL